MKGVWLVITVLIMAILMFSSTPSGKMEITSNNVLYLDNGVLKVGVKLDWGGAISEIWYKGVNLINNHDTGRLIQISLYDRNDYYNYSDCGDPNWGWNPVQGGDKYKHGSPVITYYSKGYELYIKTRPYQWNPDNKGGGSDTPVYSDVILEQWVSFGPQPNILKIKYRITSLSSDFHAATAQESPCLYTNSMFNRFVIYNGTSPWTNDSLSYYSLPVYPDPALVKRSVEYWAALVNSTNDGIGIYSPYLYKSFIALGFPSSASTSYFRGHREFSIHSNGVLEDEIYVIAGSISKIRKEVYELHSDTSSQLSWDFNNTDNYNDMWYAENQISDFSVSGGYLNMNSSGNDPYIVLTNALGIEAKSHTRMEIRMFVSAGNTGAIYFTNLTDENFDDNKVISFNLQPGSFMVYDLNLSSVSGWQGVIEELRFDPTDTVGEIKIDYIKFVGSEPAEKIPVYRLYSQSRGDHMYTTDSVEKYWAEKIGSYQYEGICCYVLNKRINGASPLYYLYIPSTKDSFYTINDQERKNAINNNAVYIGIIGYVFSTQIPNTMSVYRLYNPATGDHFYTTDWNEAQNANQSLGYEYEGVSFYVYTEGGEINEFPSSLLAIVLIVFIVLISRAKNRL